MVESNLISQKESQTSCENENCAHYINKRNVHFYKHKFLWIITIASLVFVILFVLLTCSYNKHQDFIVNNYKEYKHEIDSIHHTCQKDTTYSLKQQSMVERMEFQQNSILHQLELQSDSLSSDFTLLSVWAGVLMLVFLIFSIYSVFKTDELMKQSRADIDKIEDNSQKANALLESMQRKVNEAIGQINKVSAEESKQLKDEANKTLKSINADVEKTIEEKKAAFQGIYDQYVRQLKDANSTTNALIQLFAKRANDDESKSSESDSDSSKEN